MFPPFSLNWFSMNTQSYDVTRMAAYAIELVLSLGASVEEAIAALTRATQILQEAHADEAAEQNKTMMPEKKVSYH